MCRCSAFSDRSLAEDTGKSGIDLFVRFSEPPDFIELIQLENTLIKVLGKKVDLVTEGSLHPRIKQHALKDLEILYEAA